MRLIALTGCGRRTDAGPPGRDSPTTCSKPVEPDLLRVLAQEPSPPA